jgi:uncharacterized protein (DUF488 family)
MGQAAILSQSDLELGIWDLGFPAGLYLRALAMVEASTIYTIGHGSRTQEEFLELLKRFGIKYVIDVRSQPYSKRQAHFNRNDVDFLLRNNEITYVFMGDSLGGRPQDPSCYDAQGRVDYDVLQTKQFFLGGIERLRTAVEQSAPAVLMCSESKPTECHRTKLIARVLHDQGIAVLHIDERGIVKDHLTVVNEMNKGRNDVDLFGERTLNRNSRNSYVGKG